MNGDTVYLLTTRRNEEVRREIRTDRLGRRIQEYGGRMSGTLGSWASAVATAAAGLRGRHA